MHAGRKTHCSRLTWTLSIKLPSKIVADDSLIIIIIIIIIIIVIIIPMKLRPDVSCDSSARQTIQIENQVISLKNKKKYICTVELQWLEHL